MLVGPALFRRMCEARARLSLVGEYTSSVTDVARAVGVSPFHFIRMFEKLFRCPSGPVPDQREARAPNANPAAKAFQQAMFSQKIPLAAFHSNDVNGEAARLKALGVAFTQEPARHGPVTVAVFADTCGN